MMTKLCVLCLLTAGQCQEVLIPNLLGTTQLHRAETYRDPTDPEPLELEWSSNSMQNLIITSVMTNK